MDRKQILIEIIARFTEQGFKQASQGLNNLFRNLKNFTAGGGAGGPDALTGSFQKLGETIVGLAPQAGRLGPAFGKLGGVLAGLSPQVAIIIAALAGLHKAGVPIVPAFRSFGKTLDAIKAPIEFVSNLTDRLKESLAQLGKQAISGLGNLLVGGLKLAGGAVRGVIAPFQQFFNILFSGLRSRAITELFTRLKEGFDFIKEAAIDSNAALETTRNTFAAFASARAGGGGPSGGAIGTRQLEIVRQLALETGVSFDELVRASRRFPQVVGSNLELFTKLIRQTISLAFLDPDQGLTGAAFAVANATEGTARGFTSLRTRFEVNTSIINEALRSTTDPIAALDHVLQGIGLSEEFITKQTNTFAVALQQIQGILGEVVRIAGFPIFEKISESTQRFRDRLFELRPVLFGIAQAVGEAISEILEALGFFNTKFIDSFDPLALFRRGVEFIRGLVQGIFTGINQFLIPAIKTIVEIINNFLGQRGITGNIGVGADDAEDSKRGAAGIIAAIKNVKNEVAEATKAREDLIERARQQAVVEQEAARAAAQAAAEAAALEGLRLRVRAEGAKLTDLRAEEAAQEQVVKNLKKVIDQAEREVQRARDRLRLFDLQTADIPERFTRGRRRQLELAILRAEQEARARKAGADAAREQLEVIKESVRVQEQLFRKLFDTLQQKQEEAAGRAEEQASGIDTSFQEVALGLEDLSADTEKFAEQAREILAPLTEEFLAGIAETKEQLAGINLAPIGEAITVALQEAISWFMTFIQTVLTEWQKIKAVFQDEGLVGAALAFGKRLGVSLVAGLAREISTFLQEAPLVGPIAQWVARGFQAAFDAIRNGGGITDFFLEQGGQFGGGSFGPNLNGGIGGVLPQLGIGGILDRITQNLNLTLDAEETRRIMEEGTYGAVVDLFGGSQ